VTSGAVATIESALGSADAEDRRQATAELGRLPVDQALPLLLRSLGDEDWRVRKEATVAARAFAGAPQIVNALVRVFAGGDNVGLRNAAVEVLAGAGAEATAALGAALPTLDPDGRKLVVETLGRGRDPGALEALEAALTDADDNVRQASIEAIAGLGALARERAADLLLACLGDRDRLVRLTALEGLTGLEVAIPWARLEPLLQEPTLRGAAFSNAALSSSPDAARALAGALGHARGGAFAQALRALGRLAEGRLGQSVADALRAAGPGLAQRLTAAALGQQVAEHAGTPTDGGDEAAANRAVALRLAAMVGAPGVVDAAVSALAEERIAEPARQALASLGAPALPAMFARLRAPSTPTEARAALVDVVADVLEVSGSDASTVHADALAALRDAARDADRHLAVRALRALSRLGGAGDLELVATQTLDSDRPVAVGAEGALASLAARFPGDARALAARLMHDESLLLPAAIVIGAVGTASMFEERDAVFLAHAATAGDTRARRASVEAVSALRSSVGSAFPGAMEILRCALTDEEHEVQMAAARALGRLASAPDAPRVAEILDLVDRSGAVDLTAATVRAIGEGMSVAYHERLSLPLSPPSAELVSALALFTRGAPSPVAIAAVDALGYAYRAWSQGGLTPNVPEATSTIDALAAALAHPDEEVVKAALLRLTDCAADATTASLQAPVLKAMALGLESPSSAVRLLAVESLAELGTDEARGELAEHLAREQDRRVQDAVRYALSFSGEGGA